ARDREWAAGRGGRADGGQVAALPGGFRHRRDLRGPVVAAAVAGRTAAHPLPGRAARDHPLVRHGACPARLRLPAPGDDRRGPAAAGRGTPKPEGLTADKLTWVKVARTGNRQHASHARAASVRPRPAPPLRPSGPALHLLPDRPALP